MVERYWFLAPFRSSLHGYAYQDDPPPFPIDCQPLPRIPAQLGLRDGTWSDYLVNNAGLRLCSDALRSALAAEISDDERIIEWATLVVSDGQEDRPYHHAHVRHCPDVLDRERSIFVDDFTVKAVLDPVKVGGLSVFGYRDVGPRLVVSERVRSALLAKGLSGFEFDRVSVR